MTPNDNFETQEQVQVTETVVETSPTETDVVETQVTTTAGGTATVITDRKVRAGMFGVPELLVLSLSGIMLLGALGFYFLMYVPAQNELKTKKVQRDELDLKLQAARTKFQGFTDEKDYAVKLVQSVDNFESAHLPIASVGRTELYGRLNGLMLAYNLRNTAGPEYSPLEIKVMREGRQQEERGRAKFESLYPGDYINMTVEGTYQNLRRFMREIEASRQFVVISSVELEAAENTSRGPNIQTGPPSAQPTPTPLRGKTSGDIVSLHMEFATYYRREGMAPMMPADGN